MNMVTRTLVLLTVVYLNLIAYSTCRLALHAGSYRGNKVRHNSATPALSTNSGDSTENSEVTKSVLKQLQNDILSNLGMTSPPNNSRDAVPEFARQQALEQAGILQSDEDEEHFMAKSSNLLLIAKKIHTVGYGEAIQFHINSVDRTSKMSEIKLYFHINSANITMRDDEYNDNKMLLRLSLLTNEPDGSISSRLIENIGIHKHLSGWHSQVIPASLIRYELANRGNISDNVTLNFHLSCLNCNYQVFPNVITKQNVPFLRMNSKKRVRRTAASTCHGRCCLHELIVDFDAMGWNFVVHPRRYTANYCTGSCYDTTPTERQTMLSNNHVLNSMLVKLKQGHTTSCCTSRASDELFIPIVYIDFLGEVRGNSNTIRTINSCNCS